APLAGGVNILSIEADHDQVLPEAWLALAYLAPDSDQREVRRGRILDLRTLVSDRRSVRWRVTSRNGRYAQVAVRGRPFSDRVGALDLDRQFRVYGEFSDTDIASVVAYVRSSPRKPAIHMSDGTIVW